MREVELQSPGEDLAICFSIGGKEYLRIKIDGSLYVMGRFTTKDIDVYKALKSFLFGGVRENNASGGYQPTGGKSLGDPPAGGSGVPKK